MASGLPAPRPASPDPPAPGFPFGAGPDDLRRLADALEADAARDVAHAARRLADDLDRRAAPPPSPPQTHDPTL